MNIRPGYILLFCLLLSACKIATFDRPPEKRLTEIPQQFRGDYFYFLETRKEAQHKGVVRDTGFVHIESRSWKSQNDSIAKHLSDSSVLAVCSDHYLLCSLQENHLWEMWTIRKRENIILSPLLIATEKQRKRLNRYFTSIIQVREQDTLTVYYMNEERMEAYLEKYGRKLPKLILEKYTP